MQIHRRTLLVAGAAAGLGWPQAHAETVTVLAAASLTDALQALAQAWAAQGHERPKLAFAASSTLAKQIEQGAPADIFVSADEAWADDLQRRGLLQAASRVSTLGNTLVLIAPASSPAGAVALNEAGLQARLGVDGRLAVGDPAGVPAGVYAKQALTKLDLWRGLEPHLARADSVRSALLLVGRGEAPLGIVYATDAAIDHDVRVVATFPRGSHEPISYPFALTTNGTGAAAKAFFAYITGPEAAPVYKAYGFLVRE